MGSIEVVAAVIRRDAEVLVARRPDHKRHGGLWEFPGGKVLEGESYLEAAKRELGEELGVQVLEAGPPIFSAADPESPFIIRFVEVRISGEPRPREHARLRWAAIGELGALRLAPADERFVRDYLEPPPRTG